MARLPRRPALPRLQLPPTAIGWDDLGCGDPDPHWPQVLVVDKQVPPELLIGAAKLDRQLRIAPHALVTVFQVDPPTATAGDAIRRLDGWAKLADFAAGVSALHESGMPLSQMGLVVRGAAQKSELARTISVFRDNANLFELADRSRGKLKLGHLQALARVGPGEREGLARNVLAYGWSVPGLLRRIAGTRSVEDADVLALAGRLSEVLGTEVRIVPGPGGSGTVELAWHSAESLQGLLLQVAAGQGRSPAPSGASHPAAAVDHGVRWLAIRFADLDEFDALFGHLTAGL